jgi:hypothetical protein
MTGALTMNPITQFLALWNSGVIELAISKAPALKADADKVAADIAAIGKDAEKFLADLQPIINDLKGARR